MHKALIALATTGLALSAAPGMLTAQAATADGSAVHAASRATCTPRTVDTRTNLVLDKHFVHRGDANRATVHVRSAGLANPRGTVSLAIYQSQSGMGYTAALSRGVVSFALPIHLDVGSYDVRATYIPEACTKWKRSLSSVEHLTVLAR